MPKLSRLFSNAVHPAAIAALIFSLGIPLVIALVGNPAVGGADGREIIRQLDLRLAFWIFSLQAIVFLALALGLFKDFRGYLLELSPGLNWWAALGLVLLVATAATGSWIEARHRVQSDESAFLTTAQNLYHRQISAACDEGEFIEGKLACLTDTTNFKARGLSYIYALGMPFFGQDLEWIFSFHTVLYALSGLVFFLAVLAWTRHRFLALVATAALMFQPTVMFQFRSASVEPLYLFLSALSLLFMHWAFRRDTVRHWMVLALTLAFFAQTRQETVFCFGAFVLLALPRLLATKDLRFPAFIASLALFLTPVLFTISYFQGYNFQGGDFSAHGNFLEHVRINWGVMANTAVHEDGLLGNPFLTSSSILALLGLLALAIQALRKVGEARKIALFLALYHIQSYMILENISGDFTIEINQRYALVLFPSIAFLSAYLFAFAFEELFPRIFPRFTAAARGRHELLLGLSVAVLLAGITLRHQHSFEANIMYSRNHLSSEEYAILSWLRTQPAKPRLFVYARPWHFIGYGHSSLHYDRVRTMSDGDLQALFERYDNEIYYVRGMDCWDRQTWHEKAVESRIAGACADFEFRFDIQPVHRETITNDFLLVIARVRQEGLDAPPAPSPSGS